MTDRELGATGARVSSLCMGCWEIGGLSWGPMSSLDAVDLVRAAFDAGITTFDTAEQYGGGRSETVLGKALEGMRHETVIVTKVGYLPGSDGAQDLHLDYEPQDFSPARTSTGMRPLAAAAAHDLPGRVAPARPALAHRAAGGSI